MLLKFTTGTTNCTGVTGPNCTDQANLLVSFLYRKYIK